MTEKTTTPAAVAAPAAPAATDFLAGMTGTQKIIAMVIVTLFTGGMGIGGGYVGGGDGKATVASTKTEARLKAIEVKVNAIATRQGLTEKKNNKIWGKVSWIAGKLGMPPEASP